MFNDGNYSAQPRGMAGFVNANLTIKNNKIVDVDLDLATESPKNKDEVEKKLKQEILTKQSADIDAVSGATFTSNGIKEATNKALEKAKA